jgi:hypothetical protein
MSSFSYKTTFQRLEIGASSIDRAQLIMFHLRTEIGSSLRNDILQSNEDAE